MSESAQAREAAEKERDHYRKLAGDAYEAGLDQLRKLVVAEKERDEARTEAMASDIAWKFSERCYQTEKVRAEAAEARVREVEQELAEANFILEGLRK